jgi:hypothetical protein
MKTLWQNMKKIVENIFNKINAYQYKIFNPSNKLIIRNVDRSWVDRDYRFFHATFTIMCEFVEQEMDGEAGVERYIKLCNRRANEANEDMEIKSYQEIAKDHNRMLDLYRWYNEVDWNDPVPITPEYQTLLQNTEYISTPTGNGTYKLHIQNSQPETMARERAAQIIREQQFEKLKLTKLQQLCKIYHRFWN